MTGLILTMWSDWQWERKNCVAPSSARLSNLSHLTPGREGKTPLKQLIAAQDLTWLRIVQFFNITLQQIQRKL